MTASERIRQARQRTQTTSEMREKLAEVCHKRHGWITAPDGFWFERVGKSYWLCGGDGDTSYWFPFGTRFNVASIIAEGDEV